jgi:hypothetical protein
MLSDLFNNDKMKKYLLLLFLFLFTLTIAYSQTIEITVSALQNQKPISPYLYGRNNNISDNPNSPTSASDWTRYKDAGIRMYRENGGNNATKYNWKARLSSHPDWYNNVYTNNWDFKLSSFLSNTQNTQIMFAFQLLGKVAKTNQANFNDWGYNSSQWWSGVGQNLAGGGTLNPAGGGQALQDGNPDLYVKDWPADSTVAIIDYWVNDLKLDSTRFRYWNMDNEPDIWSGTHDDVVKTNISADEYLEKYFAVAKAARKKFPNIKLAGPVFTNEWQWYNWNNAKVNGYVWAEYFIKKLAEEQKASGMRLLDVLDFHFYPDTENADLTLQLHRIWFDTQWDYPGANGVKRTGSGDWDDSIKKEYIMERCKQWLTQYMGENHGVTFGVSEIGNINTDPNVVACWYASNLGVFANEGVELFTPWSWYVGQWEVMNLFSNYFGKISAKTQSSNELYVSGYSALSPNKDTLTIALVNRDRNSARNIKLNLQNFSIGNLEAESLQLSNLPGSETFISKNNNALKKSRVDISKTITLPKLSVTILRIVGGVVTGLEKPQEDFLANIFPNPSQENLTIQLQKAGKYQLRLLNTLGQVIHYQQIESKNTLNLKNLSSGTYILQIEGQSKIQTKKIIIK